MDVVLPTFGRPETVNATLLLLLDQDTLPRTVIVVNQTPGIRAADPHVVRRYQETGVALFWINRELPSLCGARNDALRASTSEICLFLDDDIIPAAGLVRLHWERYLDGAGWVAVGGQVWHRLTEVAVHHLSLKEPYLGTTPALLHRELLPGGPLFGGHFSVRREVALAVGGWDEAFVGSANWEEGDIINRLRARGLPFVWDPHPWLIHLRLPVGGCRIPGNRSFPEWTKTANFFLYKYRYPQDKQWKEVLRSALRAGPLRREIVASPLRWPCAWLGLAKGWLVGREKARTPVLPLLEMDHGARGAQKGYP